MPSKIKTLYNMLPKDIHKKIVQLTIALLCYNMVCSSNKGAIAATQYNQMYDYYHGKKGTIALQANQFVKGKGHMFSHVYDVDVQTMAQPIL